MRDQQHRHVHEEEAEERERDQEVNGACALAAAEHPEQEGKGAVHGRRHGEAGQHDQRPEHEDDEEIRHLLDAVVVLGALAFVELQLGVGDDLMRQVFEILLGRHKFFFGVAGKEAIELIRQGAVNSLSIGFYIKSAKYNKAGRRLIAQ